MVQLQAKDTGRCWGDSGDDLEGQIHVDHPKIKLFLEIKFLLEIATIPSNLTGDYELSGFKTIKTFKQSFF